MKSIYRSRLSESLINREEACEAYISEACCPARRFLIPSSFILLNRSAKLNVIERKLSHFIQLQPFIVIPILNVHVILVNVNTRKTLH